MAVIHDPFPGLAEPVKASWQAAPARNALAPRSNGASARACATQSEMLTALACRRCKWIAFIAPAGASHASDVDFRHPAGNDQTVVHAEEARCAQFRAYHGPHWTEFHSRAQGLFLSRPRAARARLPTRHRYVELRSRGRRRNPTDRRALRPPEAGRFAH